MKKGKKFKISKWLKNIHKKPFHNKTKAYLTLTVFIVLAIIFWVASDAYALWTSQINPALSLIIGIILNPAYLFLIYWLFSEYKWRGLIAGILISIAIDVISMTHSIAQSGILPTSLEALPLYGYSDTLIYKGMISFIPTGYFAVFLLYVVIPGLLMFLSLRIIKSAASFNRIVKEAM